jgi:hypothetical protein
MSLRLNIWHFSLMLALCAYEWDSASWPNEFIYYAALVGYKGRERGWYRRRIPNG